MTKENRELRSFGLILAIFIALIWWLFGLTLHLYWLLGVELVVVLVALFLPSLLKPVHWLLSKFSMAISKVLNPLILGVVFYLVVTPMGVLMRLFGYDPMAMKSKADNGSFRKNADKHTSEHFERPF